MPRIEKTVFISYRHKDIGWALAIYQQLKNDYDVFFDYEGIASGDFEQVILQNIKARAHFILLLTPTALKRCNDSGDWLRREIQTALETKRNIAPLMLEGFEFGKASAAKYLTGKLAALKKHQGLRVLPEYFNEAMAHLREQYLNVQIETVLQPVSAATVEVVRKQQAAAEAAKYDFSSLLAHFQRTASTEEWSHFFKGNACRVTGNLDGAIREYNEAIRLKPDLAAAYHNRGLARYDKGDLDGAIRDYDEAIRLKPDYADAYSNRGGACSDKGDRAGAIGDYQKYLDLGGGIRHRNQQEVEKVIRDLRKKR